MPTPPPHHCCTPLPSPSTTTVPAYGATGARRYLLRLETSNRDLYAALHPQSMSWQRRVDCLHTLKRIGYMVILLILMRAGKHLLQMSFFSPCIYMVYAWPCMTP